MIQSVLVMQALSSTDGAGGKKLRVALLALTALILGALYWSAAARHSEEVNFDMEATDQSAYMNYARKMRESGYEFVGGRARMPVYPFLLSRLYEPGLGETPFFERAKRVNALLSIFLLAVIFVVLRVYLPPLATSALLGVTAFTLFLFKAAYVQCELLFYTLVFASFILMLEILRRPLWPMGLVAGVTVGLAHLTKASALPGLLIFLVVASCWFLIQRRPVGLITVALTAACFLASIYPYISTSKRVFGRYFYNVNSSFYLWYDSWEEVKSGTRAHGDRIGWPDMPDDEIPGPLKYFREHTWNQMFDRVATGLSRIHNRASRAYGYYKFVLLYVGVAGLGLAWNPRRTAGWLRRHGGTVSFAACYFLAYLLLFAWQEKSMYSGHRVSLMLFLPLMFCAARIIEAAFGDVPIGPARWRLSLARGTHILVLAVLAVDTWFILTDRIVSMYGGS